MLGLLIVFKNFGRVVRKIAADPQSRGLGVLSLGLIVGGAAFYRYAEDLSWTDSFYFTVVTLTTVGYGDIHPVTPSGRIFTTVYLLIGVGVIVSLVTVTASRMVEAGKETQEAVEYKREHLRNRRHPKR